MIGGSDRLFHSHAEPIETGRKISAIIREMWPDAVFEVDPDDYRDFFAYRNSASREDIEKRGIVSDGDEPNDDDHIYALIREDHFTVVVAYPLDKSNTARFLALLKAAGFEEAEWRQEWRAQDYPKK